MTRDNPEEDVWVTKQARKRKGVQKPPRGRSLQVPGGKSAASSKRGGSMRQSPPPPPRHVPPRLCLGEGSIAGLPDRQENELVAIQAIFEGAVQVLQIHDGPTMSEAHSSLASEASSGEGEQDAIAETPPRASTPVSRYRVSLSAQSGCSRAPATDSCGPTVELDVCYGRLYPIETPGLCLHKVEGLSVPAQNELYDRVCKEVASHAGRECIYEICMAISEHLRQHLDPFAELPLHDRMRKRQAEEAEKKRLAVREGLELQEKQAAEEWERQMRTERERDAHYQRKRHAARRVTSTCRGGNLNFLPEDSEETHPSNIAKNDQDANASRAPPASARESLNSPKLRSRPEPTYHAEKAEDTGSMELSGRFMAAASSLQHGSWGNSFSLVEETSSGGVVFAADSDTEKEVTSPRARVSTQQHKGQSAAAGAAKAEAAKCATVDDATSGAMQPEDLQALTAGLAALKTQDKTSGHTRLNLVVALEKLLATVGQPASAAAEATPKTAPNALPKTLPTNFSKAASRAARQSSPKNVAAAEGRRDNVSERRHSPGQAPLATAGRYASDFEELKFLGKGAFGAVTKVRHRVDQQFYAIKRIDLSGGAGSREHLFRECALLPGLTHLHVVRYYQAWIESEQIEQTPLVPTCRKLRKRTSRLVSFMDGQDDGEDWLSTPGMPWAAGNAGSNVLATSLRESLYIQMEFCDGSTLREIITEGEVQKDEALVWKLFRQVLDALRYVHSKGLIHRDLKPANIFLSRADGGHAKLGDFGLSTVSRPLLEMTKEDQSRSGGNFDQREQLEGPVGTLFYMAPEIRRSGLRQCQNTSAEPTRPSYDQKADMFSLGVIFFEMWHPPFTTGMERAIVLDNLGEGLARTTEETHHKATKLLPPGTPAEVAEILTLLLAQDPSDRITAEQLLNGDLLPPDSFDQQMRRFLQSIEEPSSSESVALIQALFSRPQQEAKDVSFFEQFFRAAVTPDVQRETRSAVCHLLQELCHRHGMLFDLCPLLSPVHRRSSNPPTGQRQRQAPASQLLDAGFTLVEHRTNLTQPFARKAAAHIATESSGGEWGTCRTGDSSGATLRQYHIGEVYREALPSEAVGPGQLGHPRAISSAVLQVLWCPDASAVKDGGALECSSESSSSALSISPLNKHCQLRQLDFFTAQMHEAELIFLVAEVFSQLGLADKVEMQLTDTRLLPLLLECAAQRASRDVRQGESSVQHVAGSKPRESERMRLLETMSCSGTKLSSEFGEPVFDRALTEVCSFFGVGGTSAGASNSVQVDGGQQRHSALAVLMRLEEQFLTGNPGKIDPRAPTRQAASLMALQRVLQELRTVVQCVEGVIEVVLDVSHRSDPELYSPGPAFRVVLCEQRKTGVMCAGGRIDRLLERFLKLHGSICPAEDVVDGLAACAREKQQVQHAPRGLSVEFAVDRVAAAMVQLLSQVAPATGVGPWHRVARGGSVNVAMQGTTAMLRRQPINSWPHVLVDGILDGTGGDRATEKAQSFLADEMLCVARGLWRLGMCCKVRPIDYGLFDPYALVEERHQLNVECMPGLLLPDFVLTIQRHDATAEQENGINMQSPSAAVGNGASNQSDVFVYNVRALSEQGFELPGIRKFAEKGRLLDFFEKVARRAPTKHAWLAETAVRT